MIYRFYRFSCQSLASYCHILVFYSIVTPWSIIVVTPFILQHYPLLFSCRQSPTSYFYILVYYSIGPKKNNCWFPIADRPLQCLRLIKFYSCQKYKIKYCRPSAVERLGYSKSICNLFTRKRIRLTASANSAPDSAIIMCCLFVCLG